MVGMSGSGGASTGTPIGTPYAFVGSTDGTLRAFVMSTVDGSLQPAGTTDVGDDLDFVALGPDNRTLFVSRNGSVEVQRYDQQGQSFSFVDSESTTGGGTHVAVDPSGNNVFVAHYNENALSFLRYTEESGLSPAQTFEPGNNVHQVRIDAGGTQVYVPCLGSDHVAHFNLNPTAGTLSAATPATAPVTDGPRHMDLSPDGSRAYVLTELSSQVHLFDVDPSTGSLSPRAGGSLFTAADAQYHWSGDVHLTPDGKHLYATNRDPSQIVHFSVQDGGTLTRGDSTGLGGPVRSFAMDPGGEFVLVGGNDGNLVSYRIDAGTGALSQTANRNGLGDIHTTLIRYLP
jgi:6-phosphogluconolactonase